jgi:formate-dependent nitrite reductase membrane component NrfD
MKNKHEGWGWMLAVDFFFAGMGGAMLVIAGAADLFVGEGRTSALASFLGAAFMALGSGLLIFELGRPFQSWRVFMNPRAILTAGAWTMSLAIGAGFVYTSFSFALFPWSGWVPVRKLVAAFLIVSGLVVATYPGILLGRLKGRPLWSGSGMTGLFLTSSLVTAFAAHYLCGLLYPPAAIGDLLARFPAIAAVLLAAQLVLWISYMWVKHSSTEAEAIAVKRWISGEYGAAFKYGFMLAGTLLPLALVLVPAPPFQAAGAVLVLAGGLVMRNLVIYAGNADRTWLPGEVKYRSRLPHGDEAFIKAWNK